MKRQWSLHGWKRARPAVAAGTLVVRTELEDATLQDELEGHRDYARGVRHRLVPYLWQRANRGGERKCP